jgi:endonuclease-3
MAGRESAAARRRRAGRILAALRKRYPDARCALRHEDAYELLVATILSAQCTDRRVNMVTPAVFARYPDAGALSLAHPPELEALIRSTGFFRAKTKNLVAMARALVEHHGGRVPRTMEELRVLPGVGRKTANVVLGNAFGLNEGVTVDTHVGRITKLLRLTRHDDPIKVERDLMALFPRADWTLLAHLLISHGRTICIARRPRCAECVLSPLCPSSTAGAAR